RASNDFWRQLEQGRNAEITVDFDESEEAGRLARNRLNVVLGKWKKQLKEVRLRCANLPGQFDEPLVVVDAERPKTQSGLAAKGFFELLVRIFPFVLVMWSLAGALYPAVDLCAGEKERGTMETLLISPASREEIVVGKFLTIWVFSAGTALLNLLSMGATTAAITLLAKTSPGLGGLAELSLLPPAALGWGVLLLLPSSAFFSALVLAIAAY